MIFGEGARGVDPKVGLLLNGPFRDPNADGPEPTVVRAGAIGTLAALTRLRQFLQNVRQRISPGAAARDKPWIVDFPGLGGKSRLAFDVRLDEDKIETIWPEEEAKSLKSSNRHDRIEETVKLYELKIEQLAQSSGAHQPSLLLLPLSSVMLESCRDPSLESDDVVYQRRQMSHRRNVPTNFPVLDLHNVLKVIGFRYRVPVQVLKPRTLLLEADQDPATTAWNFAVAAYYKGTGSPWKLADLEQTTCHVGISFFVEVGETPNMRAAMAQVYLRTGESQVIRGKPFKWEERRGKSPVLSKEQATDILSDVLAVYRGHWRRDPRRVVIHKSSAFLPEEIEGFERAASGIETIDLVHVFEQSPIRLFHRGSGYPPVRGTLLWMQGFPDALLYTTGFVQAFGSYLGPTVPWPLRIRCDRLDSDIVQVARDIMALTKLDWNNTNFSTTSPVTLSVAAKVGQILSESRARSLDPPQGYLFYM